ncbi:uncharacterized protein CDV56_108562 [Aspergillus thermomutatus]|uniref:Uncharacterized protein n=1 Tax=Aspergillus thermomutatus TaxID=41047 RepID=A0A397HMB5_ASPTH|nr:uncharacterized protein CDV56_108562 [Aspergillus thermomutatus]RHZ62474.1 hypothetical protein CDV56_108562 [Aspergillus thermomutatus]
MATTNDNYVETTSPAPYAQAIFLSQKMINNSFSLMWQLAQTEPDDPDDPNKTPLKYLQVTTKDPMLYFRLRMTDGEVRLYLTDDPKDDSQINWDINNWVFAFSVTIARKQITKDSEEYREFKERAGLPNSNFSLAVLFIDASSTTKWNPELSDFGDKEDEWRNLSAEARATFDTFIQRWLNVMKEKGSNILGYSAERQEDEELNEYAPTFPPTSIDYFCYPWRGADGTSAPKDNQECNALSYLMMSNFDEPPAHGAIDYTGAWVDDQSREGTFCMNQALFWPWMHSVLRQIVIGMVPYPDEPSVKWSPDNEDLPFRSGPKFHAGDDEAQDGQYQFKPAGFLWPHTWLLEGEYRQSQNMAVNGRDPHDTMTLTEESTSTSASLKFHPGKEQVDLNGQSTFIFRADHKTSKRHTWTLMTFGISWSISLAMASVEDGGLEVNIVPNSNTVNVSYDHDGDMQWETPPFILAARWKEMLQGGMQSALQRVEKNLLYALANQQRLFLPGKGSYLMKNPIFNAQGDLLVDLSFNGANPPKRTQRRLHYPNP